MGNGAPAREAPDEGRVGFERTNRLCACADEVGESQKSSRGSNQQQASIGSSKLSNVQLQLASAYDNLLSK